MSQRPEAATLLFPKLDPDADEPSTTDVLSAYVRRQSSRPAVLLDVTPDSDLEAPPRARPRANQTFDAFQKVR